ncbi:MAG: Gfo/Idh/MocA family oxidoreductase [Candidatus Omnitrophica bacterium]|nr:Gfo/Idh/MocA family oxidoreductase [Candidatus Omnitrophota bacterium]MBU2251240.1 Gfo/Idh/MocA family oxidoreductase [Candidatus Omnitrophota bacterium]MBU2266402.1 Gfo/Idh/MocA family oxidoreductase [Candidatus Omnitrophota bacterium]
MNKIYKVGIVGYGYMGKIRKLVIENNPRLKLIGIVDPDPEAAKAVDGCPVFKSFQELIRRDPEIIFVCTPNSYSPKICIESMNRGKHVFCEKPPGRNLEDIQSIIAAEGAKTKLMFGFNHRFHPAVMKAKVIVDSKRLGEIIGLRGVYGKSGGLNFAKSWRNNRDLSGGGILLDQGIHMLDLFRYFCGDFQKIKCFLSNRFWKFDLEDNAYVILQNQRGQNAFLHSSATLWKHAFQLNIIFEQGYILIEGLLSKSGSYGREKLVVGRRQFEDEASAVGNPAEEITYFDRDQSWELEVEEFIKCIDSDSPVVSSSSSDALSVMEIIDKAYQDGKAEGRIGDEKYCNL